MNYLGQWLLYICCLIVLNTVASAQGEATGKNQTETDPSIYKQSLTIDDNQIYGVVDEKPIPPTNWRSTSNSNLRYPKAALQNEISGKVQVQFTVEKDGSISDIKTLGTPIGYGLEEEAVRVTQLLSKFTAATVNGKPVRARYILPIHFNLLQ